MNRLAIYVLAFIVGWLAVTLAKPAKPIAAADVAAIPADLPILDINNPIITQSCRLPDGDIILTKPIVAKNLEKIHLLGGNRSRILWRGDPAIGAIQYIGVRKGSIGGEGPSGFEIVCQRAGTEAGVLIANSDVKPGFISTGIIVQGVHIRHGGSQVAFNKGFSIDSYVCDPLKVKGGANNENHRFIRDSVESCLTAAWHVRGHQAYDITLIECDAIDAGRVVQQGFTAKEAAEAWAAQSTYKDNCSINGSGASWNVSSRNWIYGCWVQEGASIIARNCQFNRCGCDYFLGWPTSRLTVEGQNSEHGRQLVSNVVRDPVTGVMTAGATTADYYVSVHASRFECEPRSTIPFVDLFGRGPFEFSNSYFVGINGVCPRFEFINGNKIREDGVHVPMKGRVIMDGVSFGQFGGALPTVPIVKMPSTWTARMYGVEHRYHDPNDKRDWRPVVVNQLLQANPDN